MHREILMSSCLVVRVVLVSGQVSPVIGTMSWLNWPCPHTHTTTSMTQRIASAALPKQC